MNITKLYIILIIILFWNFNFAASEVVMSEADFIKIVGANHPIAKQANLQISKGNGVLLRAKGAFDPYLSAAYSNKSYDEKSYYDIISSGLKLPIWFGPDINIGYESNNGEYLNPERNVPESGLLSVGVKIPLVRGLFIDNRRASFKQAEIFRELTEVEQVRILANLYFDAVNSYWDWSASYLKLKISQNILNVAKQRYDGILQTFEQGDIPAIDTTEAYLQILNFEMNLQTATNDYINSGLVLSNFLWNENQLPLELSEQTIPFKSIELINSEISPIIIEQNEIDSLLSIHPELEVYRLKLDDLEVERRLKSEYLKPKLDLKYDFLTEFSNNNFNNILPSQNYRFGAEFSMPLFLRSERGDLELTEIKIAEAKLQFENKRLELKNKIYSYLNEIELLNRQYILFNNAIKNYRILLEAEQIKFVAGESSLFLLNSRENSLLNAEVKQIELFAKINTNLAKLRWSLGTLGRNE